MTKLTLIKLYELHKNNPRYKNEVEKIKRIFPDVEKQIETKEKVKEKIKDKEKEDKEKNN